MSDQNKQPTQIKDLDQAKARIAELEQKLDEAIELLVKRADEIDAYNRRIRELENKLERSSGGDT